MHEVSSFVSGMAFHLCSEAMCQFQAQSFCPRPTMNPCTWNWSVALTEYESKISGISSYCCPRVSGYKWSPDHIFNWMYHARLLGAICNDKKKLVCWFVSFSLTLKLMTWQFFPEEFTNTDLGDAWDTPWRLEVQWCCSLLGAIKLKLVPTAGEGLGVTLGVLASFLHGIFPDIGPCESPATCL